MSSHTDVAGRRVTWWAMVSATMAPIALIGGWTLAASRQPPGFSSVHDSISALAASGAADRWIMTGALVVLGCCHLTTAAGLRPAKGRGRAALAAGGVATLGVAAFPLPAHGSSGAHAALALVAFVCLCVWPALGAAPDAAWPLRAPATRRATAALLSLLVIFGLTLGRDVEGLTERALAGAQALWPAVAAVAGGLWLAR